MRKHLLAIFCFLIYNVDAYAAHTMMEWGIDRTVNPYSVGTDINGSMNTLGTINPTTGAWAIPSSNISGLGTASTKNTGTSGATIPLLNTVNTWSGLQYFNSGISTPQIPNLSTNVLGTGIPGMADGHWFISGRPTSSFDPLNALRLERIVPSGATGTSGNTYATLWAYSQSPASNAGFEWGLMSTFDNYALGSGGAENTALTGAINKKSSSAEVGYSAGIQAYCSDQQGINNPSYFCGNELGSSASSATTDNNNVRKVLLINAGGVSGAWIGSGINIGTNAGVNLVRGVTFDGGAGTVYTGIDLSGTTFNITPIGCKAGQCLGLDADPTTKAVNRKLYYYGGYLAYNVSGNVVMTIGDTGMATFAGGIYGLGTVSNNVWNLTPSSVSILNNNSVLTTNTSLSNVQTGTNTASTIYNSHVPPGWLVNDVFRATLTLSPGSAIQNANAISTYVRNLTPAAYGVSCPGGVVGQNCNNAVGYFSVGEAGVDGANTWAFNPTLTDNIANTQITTDTIGRTIVGSEYDISVYANKTTVQGMAFIMQGPGVPVGANGVQISAASGVGNNAKWTNAFVVNDGAATNAAIIGTNSKTQAANTVSMPILFGLYDSANVGHYLKVQAIPFGTDSAIQFSDQSRANGVAITNSATGNSPIILSAGSDTNINLTLAPKGTGKIITTSSIKLSTTTFATGLGNSSACNEKGLIWAVTDGAASLAWGANIAGGGSTYYTINCNGTNWTVMGK